MMIVQRFGKSTLLILFLAYLGILGGIRYYRTCPTFSKEFPYVVFEPETAQDSDSPDSYWKATPMERFAQETETITYGPPIYSTETTTDPPVIVSPPIPAPTYYVTYSSPVIVPPPIMIQRPFFQSFIP